MDRAKKSPPHHSLQDSENEFNFVFWARRGRRMMKKKVKEPTNEVAL